MEGNDSSKPQNDPQVLHLPETTEEPAKSVSLGPRPFISASESITSTNEEGFKPERIEAEGPDPISVNINGQSENAKVSFEDQQRHALRESENLIESQTAHNSSITTAMEFDSAGVDSGANTDDEFKKLVSNISNNDRSHDSDVVDQQKDMSTGSEQSVSTPLNDMQDAFAKSNMPMMKSSSSSSKNAASAKKSFKSQSLNAVFRQLQGSAGATKSSNEKVPLSTSPQSAQAGAISAKLRMTPKLSTSTGSFTLAPLRRDSSLSPRPGSAGLHSASGSSSKSFGQVWNKGQVANPIPKAHKDISEDELKKLGIHLTESISTEHEHKDSKWDDDDDDEDWGDTIEFGDGTKVVLSQDEVAKGQSTEGRIVQEKSPDMRQREGRPNERKNADYSHGRNSNSLIRSATSSKDRESSERISSIHEVQAPQHSPWASIPHVDPVSISAATGESGNSHDRPGDDHHYYAEDHRHATPYGHDSERRYSQDARQQNPIILPRDRFSDLDFDRYDGGSRGELYNDRSGQMESVWRRGLGGRRSRMFGVGSHNGVERRDPYERRGSSSVSSTGRRRMSHDGGMRRGISPGDEPLEGTALSVSDDQSQPRSTDPSPRLTHSQLHHDDADAEGDDNTRRPAHITVQQEQVMKSSIENARRRKEEEARREQERLEAARRKAEEIVLKKQEDASVQKRTHNDSQSATGSSKDDDSQAHYNTIEPPVLDKARRKQSVSSSDADTMDASVTAAIEFLIAEPSAGQSPPVSRATVATKSESHSPVNSHNSGWENSRHVIGNRSSPWSRGGFNDSGHRSAHYVRSLVNGGDSVWGPVGSKSHYQTSENSGNNSVELQPFLNGSNNNVAGGDTEWNSSKSSPGGKLLENWRRPFSSSSKDSLNSHGPSVSQPTSHSVPPPVGTPLTSPKGKLPPSSVSQSAENVSLDGKSKEEIHGSSPSSSSRSLSRFFPSGTPRSIGRGDVSNSSMISHSGMRSHSGMSDKSHKFDVSAGFDDLGDNLSDDALFLSQSVHSLSDESGSITPKVHLPPPPPTGNSQQAGTPPIHFSGMQSPETHSRLKNNDLKFYSSRYSPDILDSTFSHPVRQVHSGFGNGLTTHRKEGNSVPTNVGSGVGYIGSSRIPSIGAIEAVQSRIAMTLGGHSGEHSKIFGAARGVIGSEAGSSRSEGQLSGGSGIGSLAVPSPIQKPTSSSSPVSLVTNSVEIFNFGDDESEFKVHGKTELGEKLRPLINFPNYPSSFTPKSSYSSDHSKRRTTVVDTFYITRKVPNDFVGMISSALSSVSPISNPFNSQRRGGGSNAYKILIPGMREHTLIPVHTAASNSQYHGSSTSKRGGWNASSVKSGNIESWNSRKSGKLHNQQE
ncbi:hypothetical protein V1511DRAFT_510539 [Dipodascopsis uninucleata]